jgi:hypothetical protein
MPHPQARDTIPEPTTTSSSLSLLRCAPHTVPKLTTPMTHTVPRPVAPSSSPNLRRLEPAMLSNPHCRPPQAHKATLYIFLCHFGPTNPDFDMLHYHIALICYIAFILLHCFDVIHCHIALIYYSAFNILHYFDMLHCF